MKQMKQIKMENRAYNCGVVGRPSVTDHKNMRNMTTTIESDERQRLIPIPSEHIRVVRENGEKLAFTYGEAELLLHKLEDIEATLKSHMLPSKVLETTESSYVFCRKIHNVWMKLTGLKVIIITVIVQMFGLVLMTSVDVKNLDETKTAMIASCAGLAVLQMLNLLLVIIMSARLIKQMAQKHISPILFLVTYITTLLLFSGLYTVTYVLEPTSWRNVDVDIDGNPSGIMLLYGKLLFFSVSTSSLCGSSDAVPVGWHNMILTCIQMVMSFMYFACVLCNAWYSLKHQAHEFHPTTYGTVRSTSRGRSTDVRGKK